MSSRLASNVTHAEAMPRTVVIEQPNYIPWIGYFDLVRQSDVWVWYDDVQYTKRDWRNRNRIAAGDTPEWLTIPVKTTGRFHQRICDVEIDESQAWRRTHLESIRRCYARAPFFETMFALVENALAANDAKLSDLTIRLSEAISELLELRPVFLRSSQLGSTPTGREQRLLDICRDAGAGVYLSGPRARDYLHPDSFDAAGIELRYIVYDYPPYARGGNPFVPNLSIVDALAWLGPSGTADYLRAHGRSESPC
jgi:hypothetical protein